MFKFEIICVVFYYADLIKPIITSSPDMHGIASSSRTYFLGVSNSLHFENVCKDSLMLTQSSKLNDDFFRMGEFCHYSRNCPLFFSNLTVFRLLSLYNQSMGHTLKSVLVLDFLRQFQEMKPFYITLWHFIIYRMGGLYIKWACLLQNGRNIYRMDVLFIE